ncbi:MAG: hypothetical protein B6I34_00945, partial [Anaerolineaceae bacterium 4572_32.1]
SRWKPLTPSDWSAVGVNPTGKRLVGASNQAFSAEIRRLGEFFIDFHLLLPAEYTALPDTH